MSLCRRSFFVRLIIGVILVSFFLEISVWNTLVYSQNAPYLFSGDIAIDLSQKFNPALIRGINLDPTNPFQFDFIVDQGDIPLEGNTLKKESQKLINYFLASLTVPENDLWVNLSPYEKNRIIPQSLEKTELGMDLLLQDYLLKQLSSFLTSPANELGRKFWDRLYSKLRKKSKSIDIPVNTFNKIWIVPEIAAVYEHKFGAFIVESKLKVMLEEDYLATIKNNGDSRGIADKVNDKNRKGSSEISSDVLRDVLIPEIYKEINEGKNFAVLRQVYNSIILANWYKQNLKNSFLNKVFSNQNKTKGIEKGDPQITEKVYDSYIESFRKGVYHLIKEDYDPEKQRIITRKYFSGGANFDLRSLNSATIKKKDFAQSTSVGDSNWHLINAGITPVLFPLNQDKDEAMTSARLKEWDYFSIKKRSENSLEGFDGPTGEAWKQAFDFTVSDDEKSIINDPRSPATMSHFIDAIKKDFFFAPEELIRIEKWNSKFLRGKKTFKAKDVFDFLKEINFDSREFSVISFIPSRKALIELIEKYTVLLGTIFEENGEAPLSHVFMLNFISMAQREGLLNDDKIRLRTLNESYHERANRSTSASNMKVLHEIRRSIYEKELRSEIGESMPERDQDREDRHKMALILRFIRKWTKKMKVEDLKEPDLKSFIENLGPLLSKVTIIILETPQPFLFMDLAHGVVRPLQIGRSRDAIYIPRGFWEAFNSKDERQMEELVTFLLHQLEWLFIHDHLMNKRKDIHVIHHQTQYHTLRALKGNNRYQLAPAKRLQLKLAKMRKNYLLMEASYHVPRMREIFFKEINQKILDVENNYDDLYGKKVSEFFSRVELLRIINAFKNLSRHFAVLGRMDYSEILWERARFFRFLLQKNEVGMWPLAVSRDAISGDFNVEHLDESLAELASVLSGVGIQFGASVVVDDDSIFYLKSIAKQFIDYQWTKNRKFLIGLKRIYGEDSSKSLKIDQVIRKSDKMISFFLEGKMSELQKEARWMLNLETLGLEKDRVRILSRERKKGRFDRISLTLNPHGIDFLIFNLSNQISRILSEKDSKKLLIRPDLIFSGLGMLAPLQSHKARDQEEEYEKMDLEGVRKIIKSIPAFIVTIGHLNRDRSGNLMLVGLLGKEARNNLQELQQRLKRAGFPLEWVIENGKLIFPIGYFDSEILEQLPVEKAKDLRKWIESNRTLPSPVKLSISHLNISFRDSIGTLSKRILSIPLAGGGSPSSNHPSKEMDSAMTSMKKGGIDMSSEVFDLKTYGDGINIPSFERNFFPCVQEGDDGICDTPDLLELKKKWDKMDFQGFLPVIFNISPLKNFQSAVGM